MINLMPLSKKMLVSWTKAILGGTINAMEAIKKIIERRRGLRINRNVICNNGSGYTRIWSRKKHFLRRISANPQKKCTCNEKHKKFRLLKDNKGAVTSIEFLIYIPIICFILFNGVDYYITSVQHNNLENRKNYYLDIMRIEGAYTQELDNKIKSELTSMGFDVTEEDSISASKLSGGSWVRIYGEQYIHRNIDNPEDARMQLVIKAKPNFKPFVLGRLLGVTEDDEFIFVVKGEALSEKPYFEEDL